MTTAGSSRRLQATIRNASDALANPTDLTLTYRAPSGTETTIAKAAMTNPSVGVWYYDTPALSEGGTWTARFVSTGPNATYEYPFDVDPLEIPIPARLVPDRRYASQAEFLREYYKAERCVITYSLHAG